MAFYHLWRSFTKTVASLLTKVSKHPCLHHINVTCSFNELFPRSFERVKFIRWEFILERSASLSKTFSWAERKQQGTAGTRETSEDDGAQNAFGSELERAQYREISLTTANRDLILLWQEVLGHKEASLSAYCCSHYTPGRHIYWCLSVCGDPYAFHFVMEVSQNIYEIGTLDVYRPWAQSSLLA